MSILEQRNKSAVFYDRKLIRCLVAKLGCISFERRFTIENAPGQIGLSRYVDPERAYRCVSSSLSGDFLLYLVLRGI